MALAEVVVHIFLSMVGIACLYLGNIRNDKNNLTVAWFIFATIIFFVLTLSGYTIPFHTDGSGAVIPTAENYALSGISLMLTVVSLLASIKTGFEFADEAAKSGLGSQ